MASGQASGEVLTIDTGYELVRSFVCRVLYVKLQSSSTYRHGSRVHDHTILSARFFLSLKCEYMNMTRDVAILWLLCFRNTHVRSRDMFLSMQGVSSVCL